MLRFALSFLVVLGTSLTGVSYAQLWSPQPSGTRGAGLPTAATFDGSAGYYVSDSMTLSSFQQIAISVWIKWTTYATNDDLALEYSTNSNMNPFTFLVDPNSSSSVGFTDIASKTTSGNITYKSFAHLSAGAWHHYVFNYDISVAGAGQVPNAFTDGSAATLTNGSLTGVTGNFGNFPLYVMSRGGTSLFGAGAVCQLAIWTGALLTGSDATSLFGGTSPLSVHGGAAYFWHIDGSLDSNLGSGAAISMHPNSTGTTTAIPSPLSAC